MKILRLLFMLILMWPVAQANELDWQYSVKKQDSLWAICKRYVADPLCWKKLATYNQITNPKYIPPGTVINIPKAWLIISDSSALVIAVEGKVLFGLDGAEPDQLLAIGDKLQPNDTVVTYDGSAMVEFSDSSRLLLKANTYVRMDMLKYDDRSGLAQSRIELIKGRINNLIEKQRSGEASYQVITPAAVAAVRGTEFRIAHRSDADGKSVMITELLEGGVEISSDNEALLLKAGQALVVHEGQPFPEPVELLPRPTMDLNSAQSVQLPVQFKWHAMAGAEKYRVSLYQNESLIWEESVDSPAIELTQLPTENAMLMIRGVDPLGIEGRDRRILLSAPAEQ
jgi:hypothetical protein